MSRTARLLAAAVLLVLPAAAQAQQTGTIAATAVISTVFNFGTPSPLAFGSIVPGTAANASGYIPLTRNVGVIYSLPDAATTGQLTGTNGTLIPTYTCGVGTTNATITSAFSNCAPALASTAVLTMTTPASPTTEYVIFKGSLTATQTNVAAGTYTGSIRITATPN